MTEQNKMPDEIWTGDEQWEEDNIYCVTKSFLLSANTEEAIDNDSRLTPYLRKDLVVRKSEIEKFKEWIISLIEHEYYEWGLKGFVPTEEFIKETISDQIDIHLLGKKSLELTGES